MEKIYSCVLISFLWLIGATIQGMLLRTKYYKIISYLQILIKLCFHLIFYLVFYRDFLKLTVQADHPIPDGVAGPPNPSNQLPLLALLVWLQYLEQLVRLHLQILLQQLSLSVPLQIHQIHLHSPVLKAHHHHQMHLNQVGLRQKPLRLLNPHPVGVPAGSKLFNTQIDLLVLYFMDIHYILYHMHNIKNLNCLAK